jgi:acyl carrier protein
MKMEIKERIQRYLLDDLIRDKLDFELQDSSNLIEGGIIDSLGIMELLLFIERTFRIKITTDELIPENFETIEAISTLIANKIDHK